ncbi:MAG: alpha-amylase [Bacteroidales bacterium]|nr:alpha-amylase [Bacteroidales bacterium]
MKRFRLLIPILLLLAACGKSGHTPDPVDPAGESSLTPSPKSWDKQKRGSMTYQLLVYSFADSNGDGIGDFKGIENKLDYLESLGATALWLSPIHPSDSYHGYDVKDYYTVNPTFGTEADFKSLVTKAHAKGIKIYIDYVLNHSGKGNAWFTQALSDPTSKYRDYYFFSSNPSADYSKFPMLKGTTYQSGEWKKAAGGSPKLTISKTTEEVVTGSSPWQLWLWGTGLEGGEVPFVEKGDGTYYVVVDLDGSFGLLVRKNEWEVKYGAQEGHTTLTEGNPLNLASDGLDISFTGSGRYRIELSNLTTETLYYMGAFSDWMPDLNYGDLSMVESNACFQDLAASADKWIGMGVDGLRLDAVKHICGGINSYNNSANQTFLKAWYDHCNATYKAAGHSDDIFMVGEAWDSHNVEKDYYKGITSCFEFGYWPLLYSTLTDQDASSYVSTVNGFLRDHKAVRPDAQTSLFLTNHDHSSQTGGGEVRAADDLGKNLAKEKQAAAILLTTPGKPFVYQGEELGYWGNSKNQGDEYLRAPILWDKAGTDCAKKGVNNKVDNNMLTGSISVEAQFADKNSLLNVYKTFGILRNTYSALAEGTMTNGPSTGSVSVVAWYMTASDGGKVLVVHNVGTKEKTLSLSDNLSKPIALLGTARTDGGKLTIGGNSSVVFDLQ